MAATEAGLGREEGSGRECLHAGHALDPEECRSRVSMPSSDERPQDSVLTGDQVIASFFVL